MNNRYLYLKIWETLVADKSMVFLSGARQTGKTTLAKIIAKSFTNSLYCNWDIAAHRANILKSPTFFTSLTRRDNTLPLIIFDEIHKYPEWKNYLKGIYDEFGNQYKFLVTGSGRLDLYQKGGDSLAGRYLLFNLFPFTVAEIANSGRSVEDFISNPTQTAPLSSEEHKAIWEQLEITSGFPEPFLKEKVPSYRRWSNSYAKKLIHEDVRELTEIKSVTDIETLYYLLPSRIGSSLSIPSLANDLKSTYNTIQTWLSVFEQFCLTFSISTWTERISRSIKKERKTYLFDIPRIKDSAARFENMVAIELWRAVNCWNACGEGNFTLHFIKDKEHHEVDFLIANDYSPILLVECKLNDLKPAKSLLAAQKTLQIPAVQLLRNMDGYQLHTNDSLPLLVTSASKWCSELPS